MTEYSIRSDLEVLVKAGTRKDTEELQGIVHKSLQSMFEENFSEMDFDLDLDDEIVEVEVELYDTASYRKTSHYDVCSELVGNLYDSRLSIIKVDHETSLIEREEEEQEGE